MNAEAQRGRKTKSCAMVREEEVPLLIRAAARKNGRNKLSMRQIDREIHAYRIERSQLISKLRT